MNIKTLCVGPIGTNCYLLCDKAAGACAVIDPGGDAAAVEDAVTETGCAPRAIFLTHGHYDHVGAVSELRRRTGAKVFMDPADARGDQMFPLTPDLIDGEWPADGILKVDELAFRVWHTPGHSRGSVCLACEGELFSGDTLFASSCGRVDLPGGDPVQMQKSLSMLAALPLPDDTRVLPGHESFSTLGHERRSNPYLLGEWF